MSAVVEVTSSQINVLLCIVVIMLTLRLHPSYQTLPGSEAARAFFEDPMVPT